MNSKLKNSDTDFLFKAILSLENEEECYRFFEDLCTSPELKAMSQRLVVAKMLTEKKVYSEIVKETVRMMPHNVYGQYRQQEQKECIPTF